MLRQRATRVWLALLWLPLLLGCAGETPAVRVERVEVPPSLLTCAARPAVPELLRSDADLAVLLLDMDEAGEDCRSRLARVRELVAR